MAVVLERYYPDVFCCASVLVQKKVSACFVFERGIFGSVGFDAYLSVPRHLCCFVIYLSIDFRAYRIGNNIPEQMKAEEQPIIEYIFEKNGERSFFDEIPERSRWVQVQEC